MRTEHSRITVAPGRIALVMSIALCVAGTSAHAGSYRDKHGNEGMITFGTPVVSTGGSDIDYAVPYTLFDSEGNKSGEYTIRSQMLPGRDAGSEDFVLSVLVRDDGSQNAAELVFRNNPNVSPLAPILRLLDCSTAPCVEVKTYDNPEWGCWIIQDQSDIADYPIELLDARVITQLLEPAQLAALPNTADGSGNWADIMESHRTNFEEARFRADIDHLGNSQSDLLTSRMIAEIEAELGGPDDWLVRHDPGITHHALTFLTDHRDLIEDMATVLFTDHTWPLDFTFPIGRMPIWLVDPDHDAESGTPCGAPPNCHELPLHWERVIAGAAPLTNPGCYHDFPLDAYVPTLTNGSTNLGQYECAEVTTPSGFVDRPCGEESDYSSAGTGGTSLEGDVEGAYHDLIHGFIGGAFGPPNTTAGTAVFWAFHTNVSTNLLANWKHAQKRDMGLANRTPLCDANGTYLAQCQGPATEIMLDGGGSSDPDGAPLTYQWMTDCPGGTFDDPTGQAPSLIVDSVDPCPLDCAVTLTVTDDHGASSQCDADVRVEDTTAPQVLCSVARDMLWPPSHQFVDVGFEFLATDTCDPDLSPVEITVSSDEEPALARRGSGRPRCPDAIVEADGRVRLRAERAGAGDGRVYVITVSAMDGCGLVQTCSVPVSVPSSMGRNGAGIDSGQLFDATCGMSGSGSSGGEEVSGPDGGRHERPSGKRPERGGRRGRGGSPRGGAGAP